MAVSVKIQVSTFSTRASSVWQGQAQEAITSENSLSCARLMAGSGLPTGHYP